MGIANDLWLVLFPHASASHFTALSLDHKPLLIISTPPRNTHPKPYQFEAIWILEESAVSVVASSWNTDLRGSPHFKVSTKLKTLKVALKSCKKFVYGHI